MNHEHILTNLKKRYVGKVERLNHIYGVKNTAVKLGKIHGSDLDQIIRVSYLHDITKYDPLDEQIEMIKKIYNPTILDDYDIPLYHAFSAVAEAKLIYNITDPDELAAIESHTVGRPNMSLLEKIIFISDYIEPSRMYPSCVKVREIAFNDLDLAVSIAIKDSIIHYETWGGFIPKIAYDAHNYYKNNRRKT